MKRRSATGGYGLAVALALALLTSFLAVPARAADTLEAIQLR